MPTLDLDEIRSNRFMMSAFSSVALPQSGLAGSRFGGGLVFTLYGLNGTGSHTLSLVITG